MDVHDPWVSSEEALEEYGLQLVDAPQPGQYDAVVVAVAHSQFLDRGAKWIRSLAKPAAVVYDVKYLLPAEFSDDRL